MLKLDCISLNADKCESIIETKLFHYLSKPDFFSIGAEVGNQCSFVTSIGEFRIDFIISCNNRLIGIECDGHQFHIPSRDLYRDAMILGEGHTDTIYRIRGKDIIYGETDPLLLIVRMDPGIFSSRAVKRFKSELSGYIQDILKSQYHKRSGAEEYYLHSEDFIIKTPSFSMIHYPDQEKINSNGELEVISNVCKVDKFFIGLNRIWSNKDMENFYQFCCQNNFLGLDSAIQHFHGYGSEPLCDKASINEILNDLQTVLPVYGEKADYNEWFSKLRHLSVGY